MRTISKLLPLVLLASALSLSSCVNQVKDTPKTQAHDTLSQLQIVYGIPDSNQVLTVHFHAVMTPLWQKNYRIDWNFGDSTGLISKFDTSNLTHYYQKDGSYLLTLSIFDTISKIILGKTSVILDLGINAIDTNYLHGFTKMDLFFSAKCICPSQKDSNVVFNYNSIPIQWNGKHYTYTGYSSPTGGGDISFSGNAITFGWLKYSSKSWYAYGTHGINTNYENKFIEFNSLPNFRNDDSIIFSKSGKNLIPNIITLVDSTFGYSGTMVGPDVEPNHTKEYIYSAPPPILRIKFYK